jgi:polyphosphate kinase
MYEDLGLLTVDPEIGADLTDLFNSITGYSRRTEYRRILVAPLSLRAAMVARIEREAKRGHDGVLVFKMNNLVDPGVIDALYEAGQAGVRITLIIRGICCLRPGVPGLSDNIVVRSIVGRWLEHSRIYFFGQAGENGPAECVVPPLGGALPPVLADDEREPVNVDSMPSGGEYYIGSADMMPRNLDRRVEVIVPVTDCEARQQLQEILAVELADDALAWELREDGTWRKLPPVSGFNAQRFAQDEALHHARRRREPDPLNALGRGVG